MPKTLTLQSFIETSCAQDSVFGETGLRSDAHDLIRAAYQLGLRDARATAARRRAHARRRTRLQGTPDVLAA